jgi:hypothetical protein
MGIGGCVCSRGDSLPCNRGRAMTSFVDATATPCTVRV